MAFTAAELASIANAALDYYHQRPELFYQSIQDKPFLTAMERGARTFPGGKGDISVGVKGKFGAGGTNDTLVGYTHDDTVNFYTPSNIERANFPWREHHIGMTMTHTELKIDGISVEDTNGENTVEHTRRELTVLVNILEDKIADMDEQYARSMNTLLWGDGTADAKGLAGIRSMITDDPTTGTVGGIDRATATWWRNRALTGANAVTSAATDGGVLYQALQREYRQLVRYGGRPRLFLAGSDFCDAMETEMRANGYYSDRGFSQGGEVSVGTIRVMGTPLRYDPTLDDLGKEKFGYWIDTNNVYLMTMQQEWRKQHTPARPPNQFVLYRSLTSTGQLIARQLNSSGVYEIN